MSHFCIRAGGGQVDEALQRGFSGGQAVVLKLQRGDHEPGFRQIGLLLGHGFQLAASIGITLQAQQYTGIGHPQFGHRLFGQRLNHDGLCFWDAFVQEFQCQPRGILAGVVQVLRLARCVQCAALVASGQAQAPQCNPGGRACGGVGQLVYEGLFDDLGCQRLVAGASIHLGQRRQRGRLGARRGLCEFLPQQVRGFSNAVERHQDLQHIAVGFAGLGQGLFPCPGCSQGVFARAGL